MNQAIIFGRGKNGGYRLESENIFTFFFLQSHQTGPRPSIWPLPSTTKAVMFVNEIQLVLIWEVHNLSGATIFPSTYEKTFPMSKSTPIASFIETPA